jgi:hypothetical protein
MLRHHERSRRAGFQKTLIYLGALRFDCVLDEHSSLRSARTILNEFRGATGARDQHFIHSLNFT